VFTIPTGDPNILFPDNSKALFGAGSDLQIYHDGSNSIIHDSGTGDLILSSEGNIYLNRQSGGGATMLKAVVDGAVELMHDNSKKFETTSAGVTITGDINMGADGIIKSTTGYMQVSAEDTLYLNYATTDSNDSLSMRKGSTLVFKANQQGIITQPLQCAFMARQADNVGNITNLANDAGNNTVPFSSEVFDQNADYNNSNYTFTAPVTGRYQFNYNVLLTSVTSDATYLRSALITSNRTYDLDIVETGGHSRFTLTGTVLADMDANDTAIVAIAQYEGTAQADSNNATSTFSGYLVC
jgi:hypothetical protein